MSDLTRQLGFDRRCSRCNCSLSELERATERCQSVIARLGLWESVDLQETRDEYGKDVRVFGDSELLRCGESAGKRNRGSISSGTRLAWLL